MLTHKGLLTLYAGVAELILQHRIAPSPAAPAHLLALRTELDLARTLLRPADDIAHFLVAREQYQIRAKLAARMRIPPCPALHLTIRFLLIDKLTGAQQVPEIWRISVETGEQVGGEEGEWAHEKVHCLRRVVEQLSAPHVFSELVRTRQLSRNYILDFEIDLADNRDELAAPLQQTGSLWSVQGRVGEAAKLRVDCYWRQHM